MDSIRIRPIREERDYELLVDIHEKSRQWDQVDRLSTLESIPTVNILKQKFTDNHGRPEKDVFLYEMGGNVIGYNHAGWWTEEDGTWVYIHNGFLLPAWRGKGTGNFMLGHMENYLQQLASTHPTKGKIAFGSNASSTEKEKVTLLQKNGYTLFWRSGEFSFDDFSSLVDRPLPEGFILTAVDPQQYRAIWQANHEIYRGTRGNIPPTEEDFQDFIDSPHIDPSLWVVAWKGNEIAGFVLSEIAQKRGVIKEVSVRKEYRRRGLAKALLTKALLELKKHTIQIVRLHTDAENKSGARELYEKVGFRHLKDQLRMRKVCE